MIEGPIPQAREDAGRGRGETRPWPAWRM